MELEIKFESEVKTIKESIVSYIEMALRATQRENIEGLITYLKGTRYFGHTAPTGKFLFPRRNLLDAIGMFLCATDPRNNHPSEDILPSLTLVSFLCHIYVSFRFGQNFEPSDIGVEIVNLVEKDAHFKLTDEEKQAIMWFTRTSEEAIGAYQKNWVGMDKYDNLVYVKLCNAAWVKKFYNMSDEKVIFAITGRLVPPNSIFRSALLPDFKPKPHVVIPDTMRRGRKKVDKEDPVDYPSTEVAPIRNLNDIEHFPHYRTDAPEREKDLKDKEFLESGGGGTKIAQALFVNTDVFKPDWHRTTNQTEMLREVLKWLGIKYTAKKFKNVQNLVNKFHSSITPKPRRAPTILRKP